jgi:membrane protein implicated in regulation of membrane protease activity
MEPHIWIWVWVMLATILAVAEMIGGGGLLLPFAIGSAVAALLEYFSPGSITWQWVAFFGLGSVLLVAWVRLKRRRGTESP